MDPPYSFPISEEDFEPDEFLQSLQARSSPPSDPSDSTDSASAPTTSDEVVPSSIAEDDDAMSIDYDETGDAELLSDLEDDSDSPGESQRDAHEDELSDRRDLRQDERSYRGRQSTSRTDRQEVAANTDRLERRIRAHQRQAQASAPQDERERRDRPDRNGLRGRSRAPTVRILGLGEQRNTEQPNPTGQPCVHPHQSAGIHTIQPGVRSGTNPNSKPMELRTPRYNNPSVNVEKIQLESELKDAMTAPRTQLKYEQRLSTEQDLLVLVRWFINIKPFIIRKTWSSQVEQWTFQQIQAGSTAEYFFNSMIESNTYPQLDNGCYFTDFYSFKQGIIEQAFKNKALSTVVEETIPLIRINHHQATTEGNPGACRTSVGLANLVREIMSYVPPPAQHHEYSIVSRIRSMLPIQTKNALENHEAQREKGNILLFSDLIYYLTKIDQDYKKIPKKGIKKSDEKRDHKKRTASGQLFNVISKKQQTGRIIPTCTHCKKGDTVTKSAGFFTPNSSLILLRKIASQPKSRPCKTWYLAYAPA